MFRHIDLAIQSRHVPAMTVHLHHGDLPGGLDLGPLVAIDTERWASSPSATASA